MIRSQGFTLLCPFSSTIYDLPYFYRVGLMVPNTHLKLLTKERINKKMGRGKEQEAAPFKEKEIYTREQIISGLHH